MNKQTLAAIAAVAAIALATPPALACGDKFLLPGRGVRYQRTPKERQASALLIYAPTASALARTATAVRLDASMRKVGYAPTIVTTTAELDRATSARRWDVVVADMDDARALTQRFASQPLTHVLVVAQSRTGVQKSQDRAEFPWLLQSPARAQDFLDAIDVAGVCAIRDSAQLGRKRL